jgi:alkylhydroperoxidase family enzyme
MTRVQLLPEEVGAKMAGRAGPDARRAFMHRPEMADVLGMFNEVVARSELEPRMHELVRYRIAIINGCTRCKTYRSPEGIAAGVTEELLTHVESWRGSKVFTPIERLALDFAERFCTDPQSIDDRLTEALRDELGDGGLVDLSICVAKYLAIGRLISVLDLDQACSIGDPVVLI